jgi:citrate lyase subunit beta/citryl-CoA lyase
MVIRSLLYTPGNVPAMVAKVGQLGADGAVLDLEDAVPLDEKVAARDAVRRAIPEVKSGGGLVYVRTNPIGHKTEFSADLGMGDIEAVLCAELDGLVVPKVESAEELIEVDKTITKMESRLGMSGGSVEVQPLIETAAGLWNAYEIARSVPRIRTVQFGAGDFSRDVNMAWSRAESELLYARSRLAVICRAAGIDAPIDSAWVRLDDAEGLASSATQAKNLGFQGKLCVHPKQVEIVNRAFSFVSAEEVAQAKKIVDAFDEALSRGSASTSVDGMFVDYPIVEGAKRVLELHERTAERDG